ncbi:MAG: septum formation family protein [Chloroflexi bacterium]|nr:septum formation family protein [Chloroflexota bacterium]
MPKTWWLITIIAVNFLALLACETEVQKIRQSNKAAQESQEARDASAGILSLQTPDSLSTPEAFLEPIPTSTPEPSPTPRPTATPVPSPTPVLSAKISSFDLRDGDCFNWRGGDPIQTGVDIYDVELVPCSGDWGQRILNSFVVDRNGNYPGDDLFDRLAFENCDRRYNKTILPTRESWESGDRTISCVQDSYGLANSDSQVLDRLVHELHLLKGDCFNDPPIQFEANSVEVVSCRGEWEFKVLDILIIESDIGFPTDADFSKLIFNKCDRRYTTTFSPTRDSWSIGDNEILCVQESFGLSELNPNRLDRLVDTASLMAGECFVKDLAMVNVEIVSCFGDWEQKVLSSFKIDLEGEYPGEDYIFGLGDDRCEPSANIILQPSNESWQFGDRTIFCLQKR